MHSKVVHLLPLFLGKLAGKKAVQGMSTDESRKKKSGGWAALGAIWVWGGASSIREALP